MSRFRQDPVAGYWVAISKERSLRPNEFHVGPEISRAPAECPFCPGHEHLTPSALLTYSGENPGSWRLRVIPNLYPALGPETPGVHEVVIESHLHRRSLGELPAPAAVDLLLAVRERFRQLRQDPRLAYIQMFKNNGPGAGASLEHPHSQLMAIPVVPPHIALELAGAERYASCVFCQMRDPSRVVSEDGMALALAPYAPRVAFETWILPKQHHSHFENAGVECIAAVALALHDTVRRIEAALGRPAYNVILHTAPLRASPLPYYHWHIEILPRDSGIGGFELGTGCYINSVMPEEAAEVLREISPQTATSTPLPPERA